MMFSDEKLKETLTLLVKLSQKCLDSTMPKLLSSFTLDLSRSFRLLRRFVVRVQN